MNPQWRERFARLAMRLAELDASLSDPGVLADIKRWRQLSREHSEATQVLNLFDRHEQRLRDEDAARALLQDDANRADAELAAMAQAEIQEAQAERATLVSALQTALLPRDPEDDRPALVEIRAGTGGDESALFAGDLARMYLRHAEQRGWQAEILSQSPAELGGYKEVILRLAGDADGGIYGQLKFESGGHRVQRVPVTESQGRIHTSACTVAVLPEPDEATEITLNLADLRIDTYRASGAGGQHVNKTDSAIRITHLPTGLVAECQDDRSQHRNKAKAMVVLQARLNDRERQARQAREAAARKSLVGTGDRSDRIRTYNFPQGRLTDHRINLTLYRLGAILDGDLADVIAALQQAQAQEQLAQLEAGG